MAKPRDYKAEYARRIAAGLARGKTRSQARGHAPSVASPKFVPQLEEGVRAMRKGRTLAEAARESHVSPERLRSYVASQGVGEKVGSRWRLLPDSRERHIQLYSRGTAKVVTVRGYEPAKKVGEFMSAAGRFLRTGDVSLLKPFRGGFVEDADGKRHPFETDPNRLYQASEVGADDFERIYRIGN